jgi:carboxymethylenebutenolidase
VALREYLAAEVAEDCKDGLIGRREALRRLGLLGLSAGAAAAVLASCGGDNNAAPAPATTATASSTSAAASPPASTAAAAGATTAAAGSAAPSALTFTGPVGTLQGSFAASPARRGAVLIIHENRGLTDHFKALPGRFAADGYDALAIDLLSRQGGTGAFADPAQATAALGAASQADLTADMRAGLDELGRRAPGAKLAIVGFCFGGGQVWSLLAAGEPRPAAAVPFYGPGPAGATFGGSKAAVLGIYAELDTRVNASKDAMDTALSDAGLVHEMRVFPGVDHAFFNDTGARYDATQAAAAYQAVLGWFAQHLA